MERHEAKKKVTIILPDVITQAMKDLAHEHRRSLNAEIVWALERYIAKQSDDPVS
jgi:hypothetical protein